MTHKPLPASIKDFLGSNVEASGNLFSAKRSLKTDLYVVYGIRWSQFTIVDPKLGTQKEAVEFLLKSESMKRARWSRPFPINTAVG